MNEPNVTKKPSRAPNRKAPKPSRAPTGMGSGRPKPSCAPRPSLAVRKVMVYMACDSLHGHLLELEWGDGVSEIKRHLAQTPYMSMFPSRSWGPI